MSGIKRRLLIFGLALVLAVGAGVTYALIQAKSQEARNVFVMGRIGLSMTEIFTGKEENQVKSEVDEDGSISGSAVFLEGSTFTKKPTITVEPKSLDCYVRVKVSVDTALYDFLEGMPSPAGGWQRSGVTEADGEKICYYTKEEPMVAGESASPFSQVAFKSEFSSYDYQGDGSFVIVAHGIQLTEEMTAENAFDNWTLA